MEVIKKLFFLFKSNLLNNEWMLKTNNAYYWENFLNKIFLKNFLHYSFKELVDFFSIFENLITSEVYPFRVESRMSMKPVHFQSIHSVPMTFPFPRQSNHVPLLFLQIFNLDSRYFSIRYNLHISFLLTMNPESIKTYPICVRKNAWKLISAC